MDIGSCQDCEKAKTQKYYGVYTMKCLGCRERLLMNEPCKLLRATMAEGMRRWGEEPVWQKDPNCQCNFSCQRLTNMRLAKHQSMM